MKNIKTHSKYIMTAFLLILCILLFWLNMGNYAFIDTDETKFVSIAKEMLNHSDWINVKLNGENLFEYPPLIFWLINFSCFLFGKISNAIVRLPMSLAVTASVIFLFLTLRNILSKTYAVIISLVFTVSFGILVFSRLATVDILFCTFAVCAILCAERIIFDKTDKNKLLQWLMIYIFLGLSAMSCGITGFIALLIYIFSIFAFSGNLKKLLNIKNMLPGIVILLIITLPWHIIMVYKNGIPFIKDYIACLNFIKYTGIKSITKVLTLFVLGFMPWIFSFLWIIISNLKNIFNSILSYFKENSQEKLQEKWDKLKTINKFISINTVLFLSAFLFALLYGEKNTGFILFLIFPASCISGFYWYEYIIKKEHDKSIFISTLIPNLIFIITSITGLFGRNFLNTLITQGLNNLIVPLVIIFFIIPVFGIFSVLLKGRIASFVSNIILMISISFVLTPAAFNLIMLNGGEKDLINFARIAAKDKAALTAYIPAKKYSLIYYYDRKVQFHNNEDVQWLKKYMEENIHTYIVVEIKDLWAIEENKIPYMLLDSGKRYCLIQHMPSEIEQLNKNEEPQIFVY